MYPHNRGIEQRENEMNATIPTTDTEREARILRIYDAERFDSGKTDEYDECRLLDFTSDNRDNPDCCHDAALLPVDGAFTVGGGAGPLLLVRRVA